NAPVSEDVIQLTNRIDQLEKQLKKLVQEKPAPQAAQPERRRAQPRASRSTYTVPYEQIRTVLDHAEKAAIERVMNNWANFTEQLKAANAQASATIVDSKPVAASNDGLILAFKYEIHCSLFSSHKELAESILANVLANHVKIIPIPEEHWLATREQYIQSKGTSNAVEEETEEEEAQPHVEKAQQLFGEDIVEIKDETIYRFIYNLGVCKKKSNMRNMMKQMQQMQKKMMKAQQELLAKEFEASVGGGMVTVTADGSRNILDIQIQEEVVDPDDVEMLQDLVLSAVNDVMKQIEDETEQTMGKFTKGMNIPGMF